MAEITVLWNQRVAGRFPGHVETVEETSFVLACISQGRCEIVVPPAPAEVKPAVKNRAKIQPRPISPEPTFEAEVQAAVARVESAPEADSGEDRLA